ncbi:hypothetical protein KA977_10330 [Candidatus Dependentiae bacterium]|nr:hypothetical protein [Candidatus Dependentiae bacterium]
MFKIKYILVLIILLAITNILYAEPVELSMDNEMVVFKFKSDEASKISIAGNFNGWNKSVNFLNKNTDGVWELRQKLNEGTYEYKFVLDDDNWIGADDGGNLTFSVISKDGKNLLKLPVAKAFKFPGGNTNLGNKIFIFGDYKFLQLFKKESRWRNEKPVHNIDLNVLLNISSEVQAVFQLNVLRTNNIKRQAGYNQGWVENSSKVDEGHITFKNEHIYIFGGRGERILDFAEPSKLLDNYSQNFQNGIYFFDDERTKYHKFGRDYSIIHFAKEFEKFDAMFFYSDKQTSNEDLIGSRINSKFDKFNFGLTLLRSQDDDGIYGSPNGANMEIISNDTDGWIKHPRNYNDDWYHYDILQIIDSGRKNYKQYFGLDCNLSLADSIKLYFQYLITQSRCAAIVYNDGYDDAIGGNASTPLGLRRLLGEYYDEDKIILGIILKNSSAFKTGIELVSRDISAKDIYISNSFSLLNPGNVTGIYSNTTDISKKWFEINYKLKYMPDKKIELGFDYSYQKPDNENLVSYYAMFDDYNFKNYELEGISKIQRFHLNLNFIPSDKFTIKFNDYFNDYKASNIISGDITTHELKTQFSYKITKKLSAFTGLRYKKYDIENILSTGSSRNDDFTNKNIGIKYNFADNVYIKFSYGLGLFSEDEDKDIYFANSLNEKYKEYLKSKNSTFYDIDAVLSSESYYEKTNFIVFEGTVTF